MKDQSRQGLLRKVTRGSLLITALTMSVAGLAFPAFGESEGSSGLIPGGLTPVPVITSITHSNHMDTVLWQGFGGPFKLEQKSALNGGDWLTVSETYTTSATVPTEEAGSSFYRVSVPSPRFAGASVCLICHTNFHPETAGWVDTVHASALETLKRIHQDNNSSCLACHTVGYGLPTGFQNEATTPHLAGVQCENCHGPGGDHASGPFSNPLPVVSPAAAICGSCHNDFHHPTYEEWNRSKHSVMDPHVLNDTTAPSRMKSCGACHSGAVRLAMLKSYEKNLPLDPLLPTSTNAAAHAVTCATCHDPHQQTGNDSQLRNPRFSLENFSYRTSVDFAAQYNPNINLCGQCHNMRGAVWSDTGRPPHHSVQYNVLVGKGGYDLGPFIPQSYHQNIEKQCTHCHTHGHEAEPPTEENPNYTGHEFNPRLEACAPCHSEAEAEFFVEWTQTDIQARMANVKGLLDTWGTTLAPEALRTNYGALAWEYTTAGQLSNPTGDSNIRGPSSSEQGQIPDAIKQARFNLYLVEHDASIGVHNADYSRYLLGVAEYLIHSLTEQ